MADLIDRQAAIDALMAERKHLLANGQMGAEHILTHHGYNVIDELPPVQPKQTNCEYCHTDRDGYIFPLDKNSHAFIDRDKIVLKANGWRGEAKIKYCPICGRRLTDG